MPRPLSHARIWAAIDALAARHGMSVSGLAKAAGLDPTTFNKSKRLAGDGRPRWPSTESIAKGLAATGAGLTDFFGKPAGGLGGDALPVPRAVPLLGFAQAMLPEGWINWLGVVPDARRRGIGSLLIGDLARQVREARGTHLASLVELDTPGYAFLRSLGFSERGARRTLLIRRAHSG